MNDDGDRGLAGADNPYARPAQDLPATIAPDGRLGRIAGWIFAALGSLAVINMVLVWTRGAVHLDIGGIAMLVIARGLLKRSDSARRWGIGCAGVYLSLLVLGGGVLWSMWSRGKPDGLFLDNIPYAIVLLGIAGALVALFVTLLWMLLHPRTRAAYQGSGATRSAAPAPPRRDQPRT